MEPQWRPASLTGPGEIGEGDGGLGSKVTSATGKKKLMRKILSPLGFVAAFLYLSVAEAQADGPKGQGGIVVRDGAPVYKKSKGETRVDTLKRGDAVSGWTMLGFGEQVMGLMDPSYPLHRPDTADIWVFSEEDGRVMWVFSVPATNVRKQHRAGG